eukprot:TRINITY_DN920_c0_g1_i1.p1 TRINITY_DN920_c0_g1~~TRINITY_DN920_c0_g1_i1.p1  ORF type:complete len:143 (-),score=7.70 TRINITY_DN920_c0_g1_i1:128-556(-)
MIKSSHGHSGVQKYTSRVVMYERDVARLRRSFEKEKLTHYVGKVKTRSLLNHNNRTLGSSFKSAGLQRSVNEGESIAIISEIQDERREIENLRASITTPSHVRLTERFLSILQRRQMTNLVIWGFVVLLFSLILFIIYGYFW